MRISHILLAAGLATLSAVSVASAADDRSVIRPPGEAPGVLPPGNALPPTTDLPGAPGQPGAQPPAGPDKPADKPADLNTLFTQLKDAKSDEDAKTAENRISGVLLKSGSDTVDLLMSWALQAMKAEDYPAALDILDRVTILKPDYAEGWNKRATVYFAQGDFGKSLIDIQHVLALEPRHFGALGGLGMIMHELGKDDKAVLAFQKALEVYPRMTDTKKALDDLTKEMGKDI